MKLRSLFAHAVVALASVLVSGHCWAQDTRLAASALVACLKVPEKPLLYPLEMLERKDGGEVPVELMFTGPDKPPSVKVLADNAFSGLIDATLRHVEQFRLPCMPQDAREVRLQQVYVFRPNDGRKVVSTTPRDLADLARADLLGCLFHVKKEQQPEYPRRSLQKDEQGNVLVRLTFASPAEAPKIDVIAAPPHAALRDAVLAHATHLRLPCLSGERVSVLQQYLFLIDGGSRTYLKDLDLRQFLRAARQIPRGVFFDLGTMKCPFDLRVRYSQPHDANQVVELEEAVPARKALLDWLARIELAVDSRHANLVLGSDFTLTIPCGTVDL